MKKVWWCALRISLYVGVESIAGSATYNFHIYTIIALTFFHSSMYESYEYAPSLRFPNPIPPGVEIANAKLFFHSSLMFLEYSFFLSQAKVGCCLTSISATAAERVGKTCGNMHLVANLINNVEN